MKVEFVKFIPFLLQFSSFLLGSIIAIFAEPLRSRLFRAKLEVSYLDDQAHKALTSEKTSIRTQGGGLMTKLVNKAVYIRVRVMNLSQITARDCNAYLVNIEKKDGNKFLPTIYCDSIPLSWSCQNIGEQFEGLDIHRGVGRFLDVFTVRETEKSFDPQIKVKLYRYEELFKENGTFRFTIQVVASNADPVFFKLVLEWSGDWQSFKAYSEN